MKANQTVYSEVKAALDNLVDSYASRDIKRLLSCIAPDTDVIMYGTGVDEKRLGLAGIQVQAERDWAQTDAGSFILNEPMISAAGTIAWVSSDIVFRVELGGQAMAFPGRFTGVLEKRGDRWLVVQAHFSLPAAGQAEGDSVPAATNETGA
jgi:ketosteroid isomerase-like protein